ncbi:hypothetical protein EDB86DRAFT_3250304 [Lactarius hatsudake]|nr:hypothetical protein EDB86DRAFT_3250304 [Lactarius hatsudake]
MAIPLFVRSPYLSCWGLLSYLPSTRILATTTFPWNQAPHSGWDPSLNDLSLVVLVRVDNSTYLLLGDALSVVNTTVNLTSVVVSPTQTKLSAEAGPMQINLTFLNPIEARTRPGDWIKQSIPFSYMSLTAESLDGAAHATQVYSDLSVGWLSGNPTQVSVDLSESQPGDYFNYVIIPQQDWGVLQYAMKPDGPGNTTVTTKIAGGSVSRDLFRLNGVLDDQIVGTSYVYTNSTTFAIMGDLGTIQARQDPIIWAIGYDADPVINYTDLSGATQQRRLFYQVKYGGRDIQGDILADFINDFANASSRAQELDLNALQHAASIPGPLGDLVSLATAHVYGSFHLTTSVDANGDFNKSDVMAFMKNSGGFAQGLNANRVNAVETLYSAFPTVMYNDPELGGLLLEPLFRLQASSKYTNHYAAAEIGTNYPDVTFTNSAHYQGVEQSGNMLVMTYAHARASGHVDLINRYYDLLTSWADYLSNTTLLIQDQTSADGLSADNQTNLAIKGIIAVEAMSKMSSIAKRDADADKYSSTAASLYAQWKSLALAGDDHLLAIYGQAGSWTLGYNLFADVWLNTSVVEPSVYAGQSTFINNLSSNPEFGDSSTSIDSLGPGGILNVVSGWSLFAAAVIPSQLEDQRTNIISRVYKRESGRSHSLEATIMKNGPSTVLGAMYAPLALKASVLLITDNHTTTQPETPSKPHTGMSVVIKGVIGGVVALFAIGAIALVVWRRRRQSHRRTSIEPSSLSEIVSQGTQVTVTPFDPTGLTLAEVAPLLAGPQTDSQQLLFHRPSSPEDSPRRVATIPVGLSSKELARLRSLASASRARAQPTDGRPSDDPLLTVTTDRGELGGAAVAASSPEAQRLLLENNFLRHEIQQLREEGSELPPSYASDVAS